MRLFGKIFLLIALAALALGGVLAWDSFIMVTEGKSVTAEVTRVETRVERSHTSSTNTTRKRIIHLEYPGLDGRPIRGTLGHRFSSKPKAHKPGDPVLKLEFSSGVSLPTFNQHSRGDRFQALIHPSNPYFATDERDLWLLPTLFGGAGAVFLVVGVICLASPPPRDPLDDLEAQL